MPNAKRSLGADANAIVGGADALADLKRTFLLLDCFTVYSCGACLHFLANISNP
jgi:hypothetical protein